MSLELLINVIAIVASPIIAVCIGQKLQDRNQKRRDKLEIFKVLMINRLSWSPESVRALNIIDIVFADDLHVRQKWKDYYTALCTQNPNEMQRKQIQLAQDKLLESMAHSLGYKKQVTWETIQNPYIPIGMLNSIQQQQNIQAGQEKLADAIDLFAPLFASSQIPINKTSEEGKHSSDNS